MVVLLHLVAHVGFIISVNFKIMFLYVFFLSFTFVQLINVYIAFETKLAFLFCWKIRLRPANTGYVFNIFMTKAFLKNDKHRFIYFFKSMY